MIDKLWNWLGLLDKRLCKAGSWIKTESKAAVKPTLMVLGILMVLNLGAYAAFPNKIIPLYKAMDNFFHDSTARTPADVQEIFGRIVKTLPAELRHSVRLTVLDSPVLNAWCDAYGNIVITTTLIDYIKADKGAIAGILGHEVSHYILGHTNQSWTPLFPSPTNMLIGSQIWFETMADQMGLLLAKTAGYNGCNVVMFYDAFVKSDGAQLFPGDHPTDLFRKYNIENLCSQII